MAGSEERKGKIPPDCLVFYLKLVFQLLAMFSNCRTMIKRAVRSSFCSAYNLSEKDLPDMAAERAKAIMAALDVTTEKEALSKFEDFVTGDDCTFPPGVNKDELSRFSLAWLIIVVSSLCN